MSVTGECFCGQVSYQLDGKLFDSISCHCSRCRKAFNAQASASARINANEFKWLSGEDQLSSYVGKHGFGLQFCKTCGSTLATIYQGEIFQLTLGCVDGQPDIEIGKHIYVDSRARWEIMPQVENQFPEGPQ